jgi:two-component system response regulator FixJ
MSEAVVHVIDDDDAMRDSLAFLLGTAGLTACTYPSASAFLATLPGVSTGCVVTDVRMPGMNGIELLRYLRERGAALPVVVITGHGDIALAVEAMKAGAADFIEKPFDDEVLLGAVRSAFNRGAVNDERAAEHPAIAARLEARTQRERQVLDGLIAGRANKLIAYDLGISPRTVEVYRANVMTKMHAGSLSELVRMALTVEAFQSGDTAA